MKKLYMWVFRNVTPAKVTITVYNIDINSSFALFKCLFDIYGGRLANL